MLHIATTLHVLHQPIHCAEAKTHFIVSNPKQGFNVTNKYYLGFSNFEFKIRLIRLGLSFQKQKFLYLNSQPIDSQSGVTPMSQL